METIKASANPSGISKWTFTPLDKSCLNMIIKGTWLYTSRIEPEILRHSLPELLSFYPHLAGRIREEEYIALNNEGISFVFDERPATGIREAADDPKAIDRYAAPLDLKKAKRGEGPLLTVRLTWLRDGSILSVHCAHVCMDGSSFYTMMQNWSKIAGKRPVDAPVLDRSLYPKADRSLDNDEVVETVIQNGWKRVGFSLLIRHLVNGIKGVNGNRTKAIPISGEVIAKWKQKSREDTGKTFGTHALLCARLAKMSIALSGIEKEEKCTVLSVVDTRGRAGSVPYGFVGNAVSNIPSAEFIAGANPDTIAQAVADSLRLLHEPQRFEKFIQLNLYAMEFKLPFVPFDVQAMNSKKPTVIYINNFSRFPMYDIDFGTGRPFRILPHDLPDAIKIFPSPDGRGVEVYLSGYLAKYYNRLKNKEEWWRKLENE